MRVATWNVNSLNARLEKVWWWLDRAQPDVLLLQETKLSNTHAPHQEFQQRGYTLVHHGQGRWNGVAIASKVGVEDVATNLGPLETHALTAEPGDHAPWEEARVLYARCGGVGVVSIYAPNGRTVDSDTYRGKLDWYARLRAWLDRTMRLDDALVLGGDFNIAPTNADVWDPLACHGGTHVSPLERQAFEQLVDWGLVDAYRHQHAEPERYTWWDYRAGNFHKNLGMRIDHLLVTRGLLPRVVWTEIDREARKGKPTPSDHAPLVMDVDQPGFPLDAGWKTAEARIVGRRSR